MPAADASVPIDEAAAWAGVDVAQIHRWAEVGGVQIQGRVPRELVRLDQVVAMAAAARRRHPKSRSALIARLADARVENPSVAGLQRSVRDRNGSETG
ncbi:MAG TPA: hypothetical protein VFQ40_02370 [Actinomycetota bacterium]|nr:hypothetical protein [Actinomycetota bacterium]